MGGRESQDSDFKASLDYRANFRIIRQTQRDKNKADCNNYSIPGLLLTVGFPLIPESIIGTELSDEVGVVTMEEDAAVVTMTMEVEAVEATGRFIVGDAANDLGNATEATGPVVIPVVFIRFTVAVDWVDVTGVVFVSEISTTPAAEATEQEVASLAPASETAVIYVTAVTFSKSI